MESGELTYVAGYTGKGKSYYMQQLKQQLTSGLPQFTLEFSKDDLARPNLTREQYFVYYEHWTVIELKDLMGYIEDCWYKTCKDGNEVHRAMEYTVLEEICINRLDNDGADL